jgi:hypothetical protein
MNKKYEGNLRSFDSLDLNDPYIRKVAYKLLYDPLKSLLVEVGSKLLGIRKGTLRSYASLKLRWKIIKDVVQQENLTSLEELEKWSQLINEVDNVRQKAAHNENYYPSLDQLKRIREEIPNFCKRLIFVGEKLSNLPFKEQFCYRLRYYLFLAERVSKEFNEDSYISQRITPLLLPLFPSKDYTLPNLIAASKKVLNELKKRDAKGNDLDLLVQLGNFISYFNGAESMLLSFNKCPKCGGNIKIKETYFGGSIEDAPTGVTYRIGCEKCNYTLNEETFDI